MTIKQLIPKDKFDIETADKLSRYSYDEIRPIVPELLTWIQDMNWPVARPVSKYLQTISDHLTEDILEILRGTDDVWKYWTLHVFGIWTTKPLDQRINEELIRIIASPSKGEIEEGVQEVAIKIVEG